MALQKRIIIYPKDVALITGRNERYGRMILAKVRVHFKSSTSPCNNQRVLRISKIRIDEVEPMLL
ncbi:MAG: hypothetical protein IPL55_24185 [Saprospiraceae bacterium]|nr:hypothetical protein [Saprospiraceae bacterium]